MKTRFLLFAFLLLCLTGLNAQTEWFGGSGGPLKPQSPLFEKDIIIDNQPIQDQRDVSLCSAFNGWLYAVHAYDSVITSYTYPFLELLRSTDDGLTWSSISNITLGIHNRVVTDLSMVVIGNTESDLKVFLGISFTDPQSQQSSCYVARYNGLTGIFEAELLQDVSSMHDLALATDYPYPAVNSSPNSLAVLISVTHLGKDSIILRTSSNGGMSLDNRKVVAFTSKHFQKVSLAYGYCPSWNSGKYFAVWEEHETLNSNLGHIYTAHSEPNFDSPFTPPVQLDALEPSALNMCRNPVIACQVKNADNDSANITEVVLFEKKKPAVEDYDLTGYYNLQSATSSHFRPLNISATSNNELQPDISFNPYNSNFMVAYFDSTTKKLPFLTNNVNLANPNSWNVVSQGYNDNINLVAPYPKVKLNYGQQDGMNAWISEGTGGNGVALFDAPYSTYTGVSGHTGASAKLIGSYPNPCSTTINISFELKNAGKVTIDVMSIMGQPVGKVTNQEYPAGRHTVHYDVSRLASGSYLYNLRSGEFTATGKFTVIR